MVFSMILTTLNCQVFLMLTVRQFMVKPLLLMVWFVQLDQVTKELAM